ncbi:SMODS-associated NUDIX domain-containing protein [Streptomyces nigra]|uniref:SMODS-associated NUDIX domain-containing protein n=1 Tax=Streptomyces nigra TaxID=1827580 RepID=UPI00363E5C17
MLEDIAVRVAVTVAAALVIYIGKTLWQNRRHLRLLVLLFTPWRRVRLSVAVLLRLDDEDCYVLFDSPTRPATFGPPGGVVKYHESGRRKLDKLGFECEERSQEVMRCDLRGFVRAVKVPDFARWLYGGSGREPASDCMRRELVEEVAEIGHPELAPSVASINFTLVRRVVDGPMKVAGAPYRQVRFFEVYDLMLEKPEALELRAALLVLARDPLEEHIIAVSRQGIALGREGAHMVLPQSAFLIGDERFREDIHPVRRPTTGQAETR